MLQQVLSTLAIDGITSGAVYVLLGVALVLVFSVTRVIFVPQGDLVAYGAMTVAALREGHVPGTVWLLAAAGAVAMAMDVAGALRNRSWKRFGARLVMYVVVPVMLILLCGASVRMKWPLAMDALLAIAIVAALGPILYRIVFQPIHAAPSLLLLIVAVALHFVMNGLCLVLFGAEGVRVEPLVDASAEFGGVFVAAQSVAVVAAAAVSIVALWLFFERTFSGKVLKAAAISRLGCRLIGYRPAMGGMASFALAGAIGALSGVLLASVTTIYFDSGFLIGLKGFVAAMVGGLASYPMTAAGAMLVGLLEATSSYWASAYKDAIVFLAVIPILMWRSIAARHRPHDEGGQ